jgi:transcriptional regulator with XRE-family HTH domain
MTAAHGPIVGRRRLRFALRRAREAALLTQEHVATQMEWSVSKLIRIESGTVSVSTNDLKALLDLYGVTSDQAILELVDLARASRKRPWWSGYKDRLAAPMVSYIGLEAETSALRYFNPLIVPSLLQTEDYARVISRGASAYPRTDSDINVLVEIRMTRQREVLQQEKPPTISTVIDEAVLRRPVGSSQTMREQLAHLVEMSELEHVDIRVLPFSAGPYPAMYGPFVILEFPPPDTPMIFIENVIQGEVLETEDYVNTCLKAFGMVWEDALGSAASIDLIRRVGREMA